MQKANETRMEKQFPDRCKPCYCNKSFGQYIENHFYACDIEYGYGLIAVYRRKGKGYHKTTFDEGIFKQHFAVCFENLTPTTCAMVRRIRENFYVDIGTKLNISEDETEYYYELKISVTYPNSRTYDYGYCHWDGADCIIVTTKNSKDMKFYTEEEALRFGIKESKKVLTMCILYPLGAIERIKTYFGLRQIHRPSNKYYTYFDYDWLNEWM
jgi:hypothetical protein